jgi:tetratricopeptide (TPR) repeat protein
MTATTALRAMIIRSPIARAAAALGAAALLAASALWSATLARTVDEYVEEAASHQRSGDAAAAYAVMEGALTEHPDDATVYAYLGLYRGIQAGAAQTIMDAGKFTAESFTLLDKAIAIDSKNVTARFNRGLMGVKVPEFMGRLDGAIGDLEWVTVAADASPERVSKETLTATYELLGEGYGKKGETAKAEMSWRKVTELAPGSERAGTAQIKLAELSKQAAPQASAPASQPARPAQTATPATPGEVSALIEKGRSLMESGDYGGAGKVFQEVVAADSTNAVAYKLLAMSLVNADRGYDESIAEDTTVRTNLTFQVMNYLDRSVALDPNDPEARLLRGLMGVQFPFFVNKLDQGIEDLQMVMDSDAPVDTKAQAKYWLGFGLQKKGMSYWTQIVNENPDSELVRLTLAGMRPTVAHIQEESQARPCVAVEFVLGFRDELPPQTAVWVETEKGALVKTIYISGFSGHAKQVQVVLPDYAARTGYADADAVTGASIDVGDHIYVWDLKDSAGKTVAAGKYLIKVEVSHWPSMKYQVVSATVEIGGAQAVKVIEEGDYIPYLEVKYLP